MVTSAAAAAEYRAQLARIDGASLALASMRIEGISTTASLHERLLADPRFVSGEYDVDFLAASGLLRRAASDG